MLETHVKQKKQSTKYKEPEETASQFLRFLNPPHYFCRDFVLQIFWGIITTFSGGCGDVTATNPPFLMIDSWWRPELVLRLGCPLHFCGQCCLNDLCIVACAVT